MAPCRIVAVFSSWLCRTATITTFVPPPVHMRVGRLRTRPRCQTAARAFSVLRCGSCLRTCVALHCCDYSTADRRGGGGLTSVGAYSSSQAAGRGAVAVSVMQQDVTARPAVIATRRVAAHAMLALPWWCGEWCALFDNFCFVRCCLKCRQGACLHCCVAAHQPYTVVCASNRCNEQRTNTADHNMTRSVLSEVDNKPAPCRHRLARGTCSNTMDT